MPHILLASLPALVRASVAGGGCVSLDEASRFTDWETELLALTQASLPEDLHHIRQRVDGVAWQLDSFHVEVLRQQQEALSGLSLGEGWPSESVRNRIDGIHQRCLDFDAASSPGSLAWQGCGLSTSRCYQPAGVNENYKDRDGPSGTPQGINSLEDRYTEAFQRTGLNTPPCCVHHLLEMVFVIHRLLSRASDLLGAGAVRWQIGSGTLISAFRVGRLLPWEFDADIYIRKPERNSWKQIEQTRLEEQSDKIVDLYFWLYQRLRAAGYVVKIHAAQYWQVEYSLSNGIYVDIVWPSPAVFDGFYGGNLTLKTVELYGYEFPYNMDLAKEYGEGWVLPNRGRECVGRCSTLDELVSRMRCACVCAREPARQADARWHLQHWRLEQYHSSSTARLARTVVEEAAQRTTLPEVCNMGYTNEPSADAPDELLKRLEELTPRFLEFVRALHSPGDVGSCADFEDFCFGWFGDLVRSGCPQTCVVPVYVSQTPGISGFLAKFCAQLHEDFGFVGAFSVIAGTTYSFYRLLSWFRPSGKKKAY